jgi:hypothetical protein
MGKKTKCPMRSSPGILFWRRPIDSRVPTRSPATLAGLTVYPPASQHSVFSVRVGASRSKKPSTLAHAGFLVLATSYSRTACRRTTIGAVAFHFRVRNGNGWCHYAIVTRVRNRTGGSLLSQRRKREAESLETSDDSGQSPYPNFERTRFSIGTRKSQIENLF